MADAMLKTSAFFERHPHICIRLLTHCHSHSRTTKPAPQVLKALPMHEAALLPCARLLQHHSTLPLCLYVVGSRISTVWGLLQAASVCECLLSVPLYRGGFSVQVRGSCCGGGSQGEAEQARSGVAANGNPAQATVSA